MQEEAFRERDGVPSEGAECAVRRECVGASEASGADSAEEYRECPEAVQVQEGATPQKCRKAFYKREREEEGIAEGAVYGDDLDALGATLREQGCSGASSRKTTTTLPARACSRATCATTSESPPPCAQHPAERCKTSKGRAEEVGEEEG